MTPSPLTLGHRIAAAVSALMMFAMTYLQLNDPDPLFWVVMYGSLGLLCAVGGALGVWKPLVGLALAIAVIWAGTLSSSVLELFMHHPAGDLLTGMSPDRPYVEESREALWLMIGAATMLHLLLAKGVRQP